MDPLLKAQGLTRILEGEISHVLVEDVSLELTPGELVAISGPSGSGKSSLLYLLGLLDRPTRGALFLRGRDLSEANDAERSHLRLSALGFVFQFHFLLPELTALENVLLPMERLGVLSSEQQRDRAMTLLDGVGLSSHAHKHPRQLSGGQAQRVAVARALANDPLLVCADEPTGNLDSHSSVAVQDLLLSLAHDRGKTVVIVTHDPVFAKRADRRFELIDGKLAS